ncbi:hypothetical protein AB0C38_10600 [Amycolatopsis sp. NPDC048633]|uniref:hypothetical protein n=1 Tax=Amycolatopsis sp. NPDC048633 TaxID=3157095 RepID=UPI0033D953B5
MTTSTTSGARISAHVHHPDDKPAKWQLAVLSFIGLYPLVMLASWVSSAWLPQLMLPERTLLVIALVVPTMTYLVNPLLHRLAHPWLHRARHAARPPAAHGFSPDKES